MKKRISGMILLALATTTVVWGQPAVEPALGKFEQSLSGNDLEASNSALADVRRAIANTGFANLDAATRQRVLDDRMKAADAGCDIGSFKYWGFDGKTFDQRQQLFIDTAEDKAYAVDAKLKNSEVQMAAEQVPEYRKVLSKPEFQSDAALKYYLENFAAPEMKSLLTRLAKKRVGNMEYQYVWILEGIKENKLTTIDVYAPQFKNMYYSMRHDGFDTSAMKISVNYKDPLAEKITLDVALKGVNDAMLTVKALAAKEKARRAAYEKKWQSLMHGDKARIYSQQGVPSRYDGCLPDYQPEPAARASWWLYYTRHDNLWLYETTYHFNAQGTLTRTDKVRSFSPQ